MHKFIFDGMGTGKTKRALELLKNYRRVLVICPAAVINTTWRPQILEVYKGERYSSEIGLSDMNSLAMTPFVLCSYNQTQKVLDRKLKFDAMIVDESHYVKSVRSNRHKTVAALSRIIPNVLMLTGTPTPKDIEDIYGQVSVMYPFKKTRIEAYGSAYGSLTAFRMEYGKGMPMHFGAQSVTKWTYSDESARRVAQDLKGDVLSRRELDIKQPEHLWVKTVKTDDETKAFDEWERTWSLNSDTFNDGGEVYADTASAKANKYGQLDDSFAYDESGIAHYFGESKISAVQQAIKAFDPILVWVRYKGMAQLIRKRFPSSSISLRTLIDTVGLDEVSAYPIVFANPATFGTGVDGLQKHMSRQLWLDLPWTSADYVQANARLIRRGQVETPEILVADTKWNRRVMQVIQGRARLDDIIKQPIAKDK